MARYFVFGGHQLKKSTLVKNFILRVESFLKKKNYFSIFLNKMFFFSFLKYGALKIMLQSKNEVCLVEIFGEIFQKFRENLVLKSKIFGVKSW